MSTRRETREFCLQFLYHFQLPVFDDLKKNLAQDPEELQERIEAFRGTSGANLSASETAWVADLAKGLLQHIPELEESIVSYLKNWKLHRLSRIEHTLLVMAAYELRFMPETPYKVVINEAIELGKKYSTKESGTFLNGVLDSMAKAVHGDSAQ